MKAIILKNYGPPDALQLTEVPKPISKENEVLIKIHATTAHIGDTRIRRADPFLVRLVFGIFKPKKNLILGLELSGEIESVGKKVKSFAPGDQVFALTGFGLGGYAQYRCLPVNVKKGAYERKGLVALKPKNLSHDEAATVPAGALTALKNLQKANIRKGQKILIYGASGSLGTYAIQLAKHFGVEVTAVCSGKNFELMKSLGADQVIDYTKEDFTKTNERYDMVYDAVMKSSLSQCKVILKKNGVFLNNTGLPKIKSEELLFLKDLCESQVLRPILDKTYSMEEIIEAHRYVEQGHKKGNVAVTIGH